MRRYLTAAAIALLAGTLGSGMLVALPNNSVSDDVSAALVCFGLGTAGAVGGLAGAWARRHRVSLPAGFIGYAVPWVYLFLANKGSSFEEDVMYGMIVLVAFSVPYFVGYLVGAGIGPAVARLSGRHSDSGPSPL